MSVIQNSHRSDLPLDLCFANLKIKKFSGGQEPRTPNFLSFGDRRNSDFQTLMGERWVRGRGEIYPLLSFIALDLCNPWTSDLETHTNTFFFTWASWRRVFSFEKKFLDRWSSNQLRMSAVQCLRRAGGLLQFVEHLLMMEQKRQDAFSFFYLHSGPSRTWASSQSSHLPQVTHSFS